jgi:hypothetical protein
MPRMEVVRKTGLVEGRSSPGILREKAFEGDGVFFSRSTVGDLVPEADRPDRLHALKGDIHDITTHFPRTRQSRNP